MGLKNNLSNHKALNVSLKRQIGFCFGLVWFCREGWGIFEILIALSGLKVKYNSILSLPHLFKNQGNPKFDVKSTWLCGDIGNEGGPSLGQGPN